MLTARLVYLKLTRVLACVLFLSSCSSAHAGWFTNEAKAYAAYEARVLAERKAAELFIRHEEELAAEKLALRNKTNNTRKISKGFDKQPSSLRLPSNGEWLGEKGNSIWKSYDPAINKFTNGQGVPFVNGHPDFINYNHGRFSVPHMNGNARGDARKAHIILSKVFGISEDEIVFRLKSENLRLHHLPNCSEMEIVPGKVHALPHSGGASMLRKRILPWIPFGIYWP